MNSMVGRIIGIVVCGALSAIVAWWFAGWIALDGTFGALAAVGVAMVIAAAALAGWTTVGRALDRSK